MFKNVKNILLRGSWQTKNIGDIAHTPGFLALAREIIPDKTVWLWPCEIDRGVKEMLLENFPNLVIADTEEKLAEAFEVCDLFINGSAPLIDMNGIEFWCRKTGKPYGCFGVSAGGLWTERKREICSKASFIFCRDTLSVHFLRDQQLDTPVIEFGPDASYCLKLARGNSAAAFLRENGLEKERFVCVVPRLRWTPSSFEEENFSYKDPQKAETSFRYLEEDMEKLRQVITHIVRATALKVLICPEMTYQVPLGRAHVYEKLPADVQARCVLKRDYWITDEALQVYEASHSLVSMEMHSPIMYTSLGKPALLLRQAEDTWKGQMWRDTGLQSWMFELNVTGADEICECIDSIVKDYGKACAKAEKARLIARNAAVKALNIIFEG